MEHQTSPEQTAGKPRGPEHTSGKPKGPEHTAGNKWNTKQAPNRQLENQSARTDSWKPKRPEQTSGKPKGPEHTAGNRWNTKRAPNRQLKNQSARTDIWKTKRPRTYSFRRTNIEARTFHPTHNLPMGSVKNRIYRTLRNGKSVLQGLVNLFFNN
jgi:hypothetical protein